MGVVITSCPPFTLNFHFYLRLFSLLPVDKKPGVISKVITDYLLPSSVTQVIGGKSSNTKNVKEAQSREQTVLDLSGRRILRPPITMVPCLWRVMCKSNINKVPSQVKCLFCSFSKSKNISIGEKGQCRL